jgi:hypothetical protein
MKPAKRLDRVFTRIRPANDVWWPKASRHSPRTSAWISWATRLPPKIIASFDGDRSTRSADAIDEACCLIPARIFGIASRMRWRHLGTSSVMSAPSSTSPSASSTSGGPEDDDPDDDVSPPRDRSSVASPDRLMMAINSSWTTKPQTLSITPIDTAPPGSTPLRPKKRTSSARRAALLGTASWMNWMEYSSISTGK